MSKKHKDNRHKANGYNGHNGAGQRQVVPGECISRVVTDEDMDELILPFVRKRFVHGAGCVMGYLGGLLFLMLTLIHFADNVPVTELILPALYFFGALGLIVALLVIATTFRARIQYRKTLYISETEFVEFVTETRRTYSYKYRTLIVPAMRVKETVKNGKTRIVTYDCLLQDTNHFSMGNSINRRLQKGDKVYAITNEKGAVLYLIGEGKKHQKSPKKSKGLHTLLSILRAFVGCMSLGVVFILLQLAETLFFYIGDCIRFKELLGFNGITWYCVFGEVSNFWEFLAFAFLVPVLLFLVMLILMPILGTHTTDMFFGPDRKKK